METKRCSKCGEVKAVDAFNRDKAREDGLCMYCRICRNEYKRGRVAQNRVYLNTWRQAHPKKRYVYPEKLDAYRDAANAYYARNRTACLARSKKYFITNREHYAETKRKNRADCTDGYITQKLCYQMGIRRVSDAPIPPELIEAKRAHLQMVRILKKEKQKCQTK